MKIVGIIPARWASTRFEGKVLAPIAGKPMIQHVYERAKESQQCSEIIIACDDERILNAVKEFDGEAVLTSKDHPTGTDRIVEVAREIDADIIINIQGDEPLIHHSVIDELAETLIDDSDAVMATVIQRIVDEDELKDPNVVKVVVNENKNAMYFSRSTIPYNRANVELVCFKHIGIYAYRKDFLLTFSQMSKSTLEEIERLEQLRALEAGYKIKTVETTLKTIGVDTPEDINKVEALLK